MARPAAAHQHDGARVEGSQDRTQGRELFIKAPTSPTTYNVWHEVELTEAAPAVSFASWQDVY